MHSSWFRKPVYKQVRWLAIFFVAGSLVYSYFIPSGWLYTIILLILWLAFSMICSFNIRSGAYIRTINAGESTKDHIYLTFDDGPVQGTSQILDILDRHKAKASFFITGNKTEKNMAIVERMAGSGHCIGNHSYHHKSWFPILPVSKIREEVENTQKIIYDIINQIPQFFRPPFGITNPLISKAIGPLDLKVIGWTIRSLDTMEKDVTKVINRICRKLKPGSIVLLHDATPGINEVLEAVLIFCHESGLRPVSLNELKI